MNNDELKMLISFIETEKNLIFIRNICENNIIITSYINNLCKNL